MLQSGKSKAILKCIKGNEARDKIKVEVDGLKSIASTNTINTPEVFESGFSDNLSWVIMSHIDTHAPSKSGHKLLAENLAAMHNQSVSHAGYSIDNYIGPLLQRNTTILPWHEFYFKFRIKAQIQLAVQNKLFPIDHWHEDKTAHLIKDLCADVQPALLHGDLWSGNCLFDHAGIPYLIDPAVSYGDPEFDIAMMHLFGGFDESFHNIYHEVLPRSQAFAEKMDLYQLYFLLVHLNIFGMTYMSAVQRILRKYGLFN